MSHSCEDSNEINQVYFVVDIAKCWSKAFQDTNLGADKSLVNVMFEGEDSIAVVIVSLL
jgi:hypothetical protein